MGAKENRDGKTFNPKAERLVLVKKLDKRHLEVLCYEDLRDPKEKKDASKNVATRNKKNVSDARGIKIE